MQGGNKRNLKRARIREIRMQIPQALTPAN